MNVSKLSDKALRATLRTTLNKVDNIRLNNLNPNTAPVLAHYLCLVSDIKAEQRKRVAK